jgi:hypothetical protein
MRKSVWLLIIGPCYIVIALILYLVVLTLIAVVSAGKAVREQVRGDWNIKRLSHRKVAILAAGILLQIGLVVWVVGV